MNCRRHSFEEETSLDMLLVPNAFIMHLTLNQFGNVRNVSTLRTALLLNELFGRDLSYENQYAKIP